MFERFFRSDTRVREPYFRMTLPGTWSRSFDAEAEVWKFNTPNEQITVSLRGLAATADSQARLDVLQRMVQLRRDADLAVASGSQLGEVVVATLGPSHLARYEGSGPLPDRLFTCLLMVNTSVLGTFYYESQGLQLAVFQERGRAAFNSLQLAEDRSA
jgi:hypothetical protein